MNTKNELLRILFLYNNLSEIQQIENFLRNLIPEFETKNAKSEKEFLKFILRFKPHVIISCYRLEKYSAITALELLKSENHDIPLIVLTDIISEAEINEIRKNGASDCISKSKLDQLPIAIVRVIEKMKMNQFKYQAKKEFINEHERLETIFENTPDAIINIGFKGEILEINPTGLQFLQVDKQSKLKNKNISSFIHAEDLKKFKKFFNSAGIGNKKKGVFRFVGLKKQEYWIESNAVPMLDEEKHIVSVLTINRDITDFVNASKNFEMSEEKFRKLTMHAPVGIFLTDEKGDTIYVNDRWCELSGIHGNNSLGNGWVKALHPEDREFVFKEWYNCALEGKEFKMNFRFQKPSGEINWLTSGAVALRNSEGVITGYIGTVTDITENRRFEKSNKELEIKFNTLADEAPVAIYQLDNDGNFVLVNKKFLQLFDMTLEESQKDTWKSRIYPDDLSRIIKMRNEINGKSKKLEIHYRLFIKGQVKYVIGQSNPLLNDEGEVIGRIGTIMELFESDQAEGKLKIVN